MNDQAKPAMPSSFSLIATLAGIAVLSGVLVVLTYELSLPRITQNRLEALERAVFNVLPGAVSRANYRLTEDELVELAQDDIAGANMFAGYNEKGELVGVAMEASARGYQDVVRILYGYAPDTECVIGFTVLQSTETPGLGDKVETDPGFLANFDCLEAKLDESGAAMKNEIVTVKNGKKTGPWQVEGISGATVTSTAIGNALQESTRTMLPSLFRHRANLKTGKEDL